ncbi:hypothetical protein JHK85_035651 [Glycine max]|nr:hypothetical protein JHK85_035651 [Glycine max]KHN41340.1 hypothetical protein glysoja_042685 [Glycine soja]
MVQQFTGGPSAPFASNPSLAPQVLPNLMGFGFPSRPVPSPTTLVMSPPPITNLQQQHMFQQQNQQYNLYSTGGGAQGGGDSNNNMFFQRLSNNVNPMSSPTSNVVVSNSNRGDGGAVNMDHGRFFPNTSSSS